MSNVWHNCTYDISFLIIHLQKYYGSSTGCKNSYKICFHAYFSDIHYTTFFYIIFNFLQYNYSSDIICIFLYTFISLLQLQNVTAISHTHTPPCSAFCGLLTKWSLHSPFSLALPSLYPSNPYPLPSFFMPSLHPSLLPVVLLSLPNSFSFYLISTILPLLLSLSESGCV